MTDSDESVPLVRRERDSEMARLGWVRRFTAAPPRLEELCRLYEELGHDVILDRMRPDELSAGCEGCTLALTLFRVIYTRAATPAGAPPAPDALPHDGRHQ